MRSIVFLQCLFLLSSSTKHSFCLATDEGAQTFTFFKRSVDLPGPSMSFNASLKTGIFEFEFKTFVERALLLYQDDDGDWDYIRLEINEGRLGIAFRINSDDVCVFNTADGMLFNDFHWHKVRVERNLTHFMFVVDGKTMKVQATSSPNFLSNLQLGGFPKRRSDRRTQITSQEALLLYVTPMNWRGFFLGCIRNIKYGANETKLIPINDIPCLRSNVTKGNCDLNLCQKRRKDKPPGICENNGVCKPSGKNSAVCDCRWTGYDGSSCTKEALRLTLNGSYKVAYKLRTQVPLVVKKEQFTLRIKTARENATILVAEATNGSSDKLTLEIKDSRFVVTSYTGGGQGEDILRSNEVIGDNVWHLVKYTRNGGVLSLDVDGKTVNHVSSKLDFYMNYNILYIGSSSNPHNLTLEVEDFIWEYQDKKINFIKGLFESFGSSRDEYTVMPKEIRPVFNWKLPTRNEEMNTSITTASTYIDDCAKASKECHSDAYCSITEGSHVCICKTGYTGDAMYNCTDIDECKGSSVPCHEQALCINTNGSYNCTCRPGFYGDGHFNCTDVDECTETPASCLGYCRNTLGSYSCSCSNGFTGDGKHNCTDIDECAESADICGEHAKCKNTEGSFSCIKVCGVGYTQNEHGNCADVDECAKDNSVCNPIATCMNVEGSFLCKCPDKHHGDGVSICLPNNPCDALPCFPGLKCSKTTNDTYSCEKCPPFFVGDGVNCKRSKDILSKKIGLVLKNEKWKSKLNNKSSFVYKALATKLIEKIKAIYEGHPKFVYAYITKFRKGSVVAETELVFMKDVKNPFNLLEEAINDGKLANVTVETRQDPPVSFTSLIPTLKIGTTDSKDNINKKDKIKKDNILGLDQTIFICVVALVAGVCILGIAVLIFLLIIRRSRSRNAQISSGEEKESLNTKEPQGLLYKT